MSIETVPDTDWKYYLITHDAEGNERKDDPGGLMSQVATLALQDAAVTDVFLLCHGWRGDVPAARAQYNHWIGAMLKCPADMELMKQKRPGFHPVLIGLHWPSEPWGDETFSQQASYAVPGADLVEELVNEAALKTADSEAARQALRTIMSAALEEDAEPRRLPDNVRKAYEILDQEIGLGAGGEGDAPGDDREPFDPDFSYAEGKDDAVSFGVSDTLLEPLRVLSFYRMKKRGRSFGEAGAHRLVAGLMNATAGRGVRFHLMGHSFGCIVVSAAVAGPSGSTLPGPVDLLALIQGALSLWSYCAGIPKARGKPGYFYRLIADRRVQGPIITTQSEFDRAVGTWYPVAAGARRQVDYRPTELPKYGALGTFGVQGPGAQAEDKLILRTDASYGFKPGKIYNIESSGVINAGRGFSGAHNDIAKPEVAHAVWEAAMATAQQP